MFGDGTTNRQREANRLPTFWPAQLRTLIVREYYVNPGQTRRNEKMRPNLELQIPLNALCVARSACSSSPARGYARQVTAAQLPVLARPVEPAWYPPFSLEFSISTEASVGGARACPARSKERRDV